jgi:ATP-dependent Clp protease ATP-binding subunit ClpX
VRQYQRLFEMADARLEFAPQALEAIADLAILRETGVRALRSILEDLLLDLLFELPSRRDQREFVVTPEVVRGAATLALGLTPAQLAEEEEASDEVEPSEDDDGGLHVERESA